MKDFSSYSDEDLLELVVSNPDLELKKRGYEYGWHKKEQFVGAIYILVNPAFNDLVKIGYADDVLKRMNTLNRNSGLPDPFHCYALYNVKKRLGDVKLHTLIDSLDPSLRHSKNREFYEMNCQKAYDILSAIAQINGNEEQLVINPFSDSFFNSIQKNTPSLNVTSDTSNQKTERLTFEMLSIPVGSTLVYVRDNRITCVTKDNVNQVAYNGSIYSISKLARMLNKVKAAQGGQYFMYNGEILTDIRKRLGV